MIGSPPRTRVVLCGPLGLEIDGRDVASALPGGQAGCSRAYLLARPERAADRDALVELLWPRRAPNDPGAALRPLLSRLRRALAPATLEGRERLRLALPEPVWIDVEAAARAVDDARAAATRRPLGGRRASMPRPRSSSCVPGLLPAQDGDWLQAARWEHEELLLEALEAAARSGVALGRTGARRRRAREPRADRPLAVPRDRLSLPDGGAGRARQRRRGLARLRAAARAPARRARRRAGRGRAGAAPAAALRRGAPSRTPPGRHPLARDAAARSRSLRAAVRRPLGRAGDASEARALQPGAGRPSGARRRRGRLGQEPPGARVRARGGRQRRAGPPRRVRRHGARAVRAVRGGARPPRYG